MRQRLSNLLLEIHNLLRDKTRDRGNQPGSQLERDVEWLASFCWLSSYRRTKQVPFGGAYYSGLHPETDLFVYDAPQFLQIEIKDTNVSRLAVTELWARALPTLGTRLHVISPRESQPLCGACYRWLCRRSVEGRVPPVGNPFDHRIGDCEWVKFDARHACFVARRLEAL